MDANARISLTKEGPKSCHSSPNPAVLLRATHAAVERVS
jgi:hypothetical protein